MDDPRLPRFFYLVLLFASLAMFVYYYPQMPPRMASHFAADGHPNGWMPREPFFVLTLVITSLSGLVGFVAPRQIATRPDARINLPNRDYWLAPERRAQTFQYFATMMAWFSCGLLFVLISGTFLAIRANLASGGRFDSGAMVAMLIAFLLFLMLWMLRFIRHFRRLDPPSK